MIDWALQERLKREYQRANKQNETGIDEDDEADDDTPKTRQAKALEKMIRDREGNNAYESDEDKNPYASSVRHTPHSASDNLTLCAGGRRGGGARACPYRPRYSTAASTGRP
jgi:hypothetical protein